MKTIADFHFEIAQRELEQLKECPDPVRLGGGGEYSDHFRHAIACSLFSALAVEHAVTELIWVKWVFPPVLGPYRGARSAPKMQRKPVLLQFLRDNTGMSSELIDDMDTLFHYRDQVAHAHPKRFRGKRLDFDIVQDLLVSGRGEELNDAVEKAFESGDRSELEALKNEVGKEELSLTFDSLSTQDLDLAEKNLQIASRALKALREEWDAEGN